MRWLLLLAYGLSGAAGLIYEVSWTRLLTLFIGHTTAAAGAVVGAFLGGLALGAAAGGAVASRMGPRRALAAYALIEVVVAAAALALPWEIEALRPVLSWAYADGAPGPWFPLVRLASCLVMVFLPATALGATFPMAVRWYAHGSDNAARSAGALYVTNTAGAAAGALLAGFVLIPVVGISGATWVGVAASIAAAAAALALARSDRTSTDRAAPPPPPRSPEPESPARGKGKRPRASSARAGVESAPRWLAIAVLGVSGFAALLHEIAWTRILALVLGPTTYAFAATLAVTIAGMALGSGAGARLVARTRRPAAWLAMSLAAAAAAVAWTTLLAGTSVPIVVARQVAAAAASPVSLLAEGAALAVALLAPSAFCLGAAFPLGLAVAHDPAKAAAGRFGWVYAVNTACAVAGSLAAGFVLIPSVGLRTTLVVAAGCLGAAALAVAAWGRLTHLARAATGLAVAAAAAILVAGPPWDRDLLASGVYLYAPFVPPDLDLATQLRAGEVLYYREGASATVSVKRLTGTTTLAVDGKTDASNRGDMITQKLIAHLPLLLHDDPREVAIIGLGSGVTVGSALRHPIARADVLEISPEVVEASRFFDAENQRALDDPRVNVIVGDGRSHLVLSSRRYDAIVSEPSNPWMAGVAALFTREFFGAARARLAPGGLMCQWANAYNISDADLRAIVATFREVFPESAVWLVGESDVLMVGTGGDGTGAAGSIDARLERMARHWNRPGVAEDLASVGVAGPFALVSMLVAGPDEMARYAGGASVLTDDTMRLEFSAPREMHRAAGGATNVDALAALSNGDAGPRALREARAAAGTAEWRSRGDMLARADLPRLAYDDYVRALSLDAGDAAALDGLVRAAVLARRGPEALDWVRSLPAARQARADVLVARSKLLASVDARPEAIEVAQAAAAAASGEMAPLEQLASLLADAGDTVRLDLVVGRLREVAPARPATLYYGAVAEHLHGRPADAVRAAEAAIAADAAYAPTYDLLGAARLRLGDAAGAREAFLKSLAFDAHDSTAYTNLGLIALASGDRARAAGYFAEALWLEPDSPAARKGLAEVGGGGW